MSSSPGLNRPIPCAKCGYDLRGTPAGGNCPECGLSVMATVARVGLSGATPDGDQLIVTDATVLPPRCIKTNSTEDLVAVDKDLYWIHPLAYIATLSPLIFLIIYYVLRKKCHVTYFLTRQQKAKIQTWTWLGWGLFAFSFVVLCGGSVALPTNVNGPGLVLIPFLIMLATSLILLYWMSNTLSISAHKDGKFWIKGICRAFIDEMPQAS